MPTFDVITIGSALLDIYLKSDEFTKLSSTKFPDGSALALEFGGKTEIDDIEVCSGGAATNNAVSFARKGIKTAIIAELGTDLIAATIKEELKREKVDVGMLVEEHDEETGISCILVHPEGGRSVAVFRGASKMLTVEDMPWHKLDTRWLFISSVGGDIKLLTEIITFAADNQIKIAFNPGKKELELASQWLGLIPKLSVLFINKEEHQVLTEHVADINPQILCITDGAQGGTVITSTENIPFKSKPMTAVEETGAGDAFGSGFVAALIHDQSIQTAINWGINQATSVISFMGAKRGLLTLDQIKA